ncbi:MAG: CoB--CoM heterodisulfide reductase iron-sulfur subunit A family protein [Nitrospinae bacterium]|nr:CoB--CoM heterodisulfide reductase iron-sulfur subunit A family protein [Nitrospinota bacterium]
MNNSLLVIGGGIAGMTAAVEAAECGQKVYLIEKEAYLGGRVARMNKYFPKLCPPYCGMEINFRRIRVNPHIEILTLSEVVSITGQKGDFTATIKTAPRYVNNKCTTCKECEGVCPVSRPDEFNYGMSQTKAVYLPHAMAMPMKHVIDMSVCKGQSCGECAKVCNYGAIDLSMEPSETQVKVASVVYATGWKPYDASKIANLGYGSVANVINNVEMERLAAINGPTGGKILRRDNGGPVNTVAFVQCAGSRDENHLQYCSSICCLASLKQATYVREQYPDSEVYVFYIDLRAPGKYEAFYTRVAADPKIKVIKGKVAKVEQAPDGRAVVTAEDIMGGGKMSVSCDLVVLATGMEPAYNGNGVKPDGYGFMPAENMAPGVFSTGVAKRPQDVTSSIQDATGAALFSLQCSAGEASHG